MIERIWRRAQAWLRREDYVRQAVQAAAASAMQEGYRIGFAHGELRGRQDLAHELQVAHGVDGGAKFLTPEEIRTLGVRQLH